jgi:hypothetical protein
MKDCQDNKVISGDEIVDLDPEAPQKPTTDVKLR